MESTLLFMVIGLAGILVGVIIGFWVASAKTKVALAAYRLQADGNRRILESTIAELRNRTTEMKAGADATAKENSSLQDKLRFEAEQKASAQAELRETRSAVDGLSTVRDQLLTEGQAR